MKDQVQFETNGITVLSVKVFDATYTSFISNGELITRHGYEFHQEQREIKLSEGDWSIHTVTPDITEEEAKVLAVRSDRHPDMELYEDALEESTRYAYLLKSPIEAAQNILRYHGIDPKQKNVLLIKGK